MKTPKQRLRHRRIKRLKKVIKIGLLLIGIACIDGVIIFPLQSLLSTMPDMWLIIKWLAGIGVVSLLLSEYLFKKRKD